VLEGKYEGKRPIGSSRRRCDNTEIDLEDSGWKKLECIRLAQNRDLWKGEVPMGILMNHQVPYNTEGFLNNSTY
jgi:hypothetical protein